MAIRDHVHRVSKMRVLITTVDPSQRLIHAVGADGGAKQIAIFDVPSQFTWPVEGEQWSAYEENGYWYLGNKFLDPQESADFESLNPGDPIYGPKWHKGFGSPEGVIDAQIGSLYTRRDGGVGTTLYVKEEYDPLNPKAGWAAK